MMDMDCDEVNPTAVEAVEEKGAAGEAKEQEGLNCGGAAQAEGKLSGSNGVVAAPSARSSDSPTKIKDGSRPTTPEVNMPMNAPGQLTIFCAGRVHVFDGIPPEKVKEIMLIAAAAAANSLEKMKIGTDCPISAPVLTRCPSLLSTSAAVASPQAQLLPSKLQTELPIARRHSLQRFFEKRRDRLVSKSPYPTTKPAEDTKSRMGVEPSPGAGCFGKSSILGGEFQTSPAAPAHLA